MSLHLLRFILSALLLIPAGAIAENSPEPHAPVWSYMGGGNDDEGWGTLSEEYATCDLGRNQSPIQLNDTKLSTMPLMKIAYHTAKMTMEKKDRTLVTSMQGIGTLTDQGHRYKLQEMRIHTPAEHEIAGKLFPVELHLIHKDAKGKILILGIFMDYGGEANPALQAILDKAPHLAKTTVPVSFDPNQLLPKKRGYYAYSGSLSWPPCTEGVEWRVFKDSVSLNKDQMKAVGELLGRNARLLQPTYFRTIRETIGGN